MRTTTREELRRKRRAQDKIIMSLIDGATAETLADVEFLIRRLA